MRWHLNGVLTRISNLCSLLVSVKKTGRAGSVKDRRKSKPYDAWASAVESALLLSAHFRRGLKPSRHGAFFMGRTPPVSSAPDSVARKKRHHADTPPVVVPACQRGTGVVESTRVESRLSMNESLPPWATGRSLLWGCWVWCGSPSTPWRL